MKAILHFAILATFLLTVSGPAPAYPADGASLVINEILARNDLINTDPQGEYEDWIEIHNAGDAAVNMAGLYLTDDLSDPTQWRMPPSSPALTTIPAGGYLVVWADNEVSDPGLHAGFQLGSTGGDIALFDTDGSTLIDTLHYDRQTPDVSFGRDPDASETWVTLTPTPGASNDGSFLAVVADTTFSYDRGFYDQPFEVAIATETEGATIRYTLDGSTPTPSHGTVYTNPVLIGTTTCLRAMAFQPGWKSTNVDTQTYFFLDSVIQQATHPTTGAQITPPGCPVSWGSITGDYQVDPDVVGQNGKDIFAGRYARTIKDDLMAVPTISLVMNIDDWFGKKGIYINQSQDGTERVASMEFIDPASGDGFQLNCAIAMQGGISGGGTSLSRWKTAKLSMRPRFKTQIDDGTPTGGPPKLDFKVFPDSPLQRYNTVVLDAVLNHSWLHPGSDQRNTVTYLQDQYVADLHNAMGGHSPHGAYAHVYINGLYWGMYYTHERPDHAWAAQIFGGDEDEYDALKHSSSGVINDGIGGSARANFNAMVAAASAVSSAPTDTTKYAALCELLDVDDFITYLLANWYTGNHDWPHKNWYATHRNSPDGRWRFHSWDAEHTLEGSNDVGKSPADIHSKLARNAEYRMRFADLAHKHFFNDGPLSYPATADRYQGRMDQAEQAIVGESARWGDNRQSRPYTQQDWLAVQEGKLNSMFPGRSSRVLGWLKNADLYPDIDAPQFAVDGRPQHGGQVESGDALSIAASGSTIWYTLDGTDPRTPGAAGTPGEQVVLLPEAAPKLALVPTGAVDEAWRTDPDFDDSAWTSGTGGVGYERSSGYEPLFAIDIPQMYGANTSCYIRIPFDVAFEDVLDAGGFTLKVRYDDGFVAYLNGTEIQRAQFNGVPSWNSSASASHSDIDAVDFEVFDISDHISQFRLGRNVLAIHGMNNSATSSDFLISVELSVSRGASGGTASGVSPTAARYTSPRALDTSTQVKARALKGDTWSALSEAVFAVGPVAQSLRISEIMYHPAATGHPDDPNTEYIELTNIGTETINLNLVKFTNGVDFTFPRVQLTPGDHVLVVKDIPAFEAKYGPEINVAGQYIGSLNNAGERIELEDAAGQTIHDFQFKDGWYEITDGAGFALTVRDPAGDPSTLSDKQAWRPSAAAGGSPGFDDTGDLPELGSVVINELLANSEAGAPDWIELHNTADQAIDIGGWFLSDDGNNVMKYEIAPGTILASGGFLVFFEDQHFANQADPGCHTPFALSRNGETVYLHSGSAGVLTGYSEEVKFGSAEPGVSLGRSLNNGTGTVDFVALSEPTPGWENAGPAVTPQ